MWIDIGRETDVEKKLVAFLDEQIVQWSFGF